MVNIAQYHKCRIIGAAVPGSKNRAMSKSMALRAVIAELKSLMTMEQVPEYASGMPSIVLTTLRKSPEAAKSSTISFRRIDSSPSFKAPCRRSSAGTFPQKY